MFQFPQLFFEPGTFLICGSYIWWKDADSCCVSFHPLSSGFCDCLVKRVARSWHCKCWKATSWKLKPQSAGNYLGLLFALPQSVTNKYALYPCKCLAVNSIPSGWGSFLLPLPLCICLYVSRSLSLPLLAGRSVCAAGRSDQNKNSNTRHRRGNKAKWSTEPECLPSHNYVELFPFFTLPLLLFFSSLFETSGLVVISQKRIKPADRERGGAFWSEMANRNILLLFCGLFLLALLQPSLQGGKCITAGEWSHNYCCINQRFRTGAKKFCS